MGGIIVIVGPMYSGKTEELIKRIKEFSHAKKKCMLFKHNFDTRYDKDFIVTHNGIKEKCIVTKNSNEIKNKINTCIDDIDVIGIDEVQFFDDNIVTLLEDLANIGKVVVVAGLDMDYMGNPFGPMSSILAIADEIVKLKAICSICGKDAMFSKRIIEKKGTILVGAAESYTPVCREHFNKKTSNSFYSHKKE